MSRFEVDSVRVEQASSAVTSSIASIGAEVDRMMRNLLDLQNSWRGQASTSFQGVVADWRGTQDRVRQSLQDIGTALGAAGQQYSEVEQRAAQMFRG